jgi:hypothetical protein
MSVNSISTSVDPRDIRPAVGCAQRDVVTDLPDQGDSQSRRETNEIMLTVRISRI